MSWAQTAVISGNGKFVGDIQFLDQKVGSEYLYQVKIFNVPQTGLLQTFQVALPSKRDFEIADLNYNGKVLHLKQDEVQYLFNTLTGKKIARFDVPVLLVPAHSDNFIIASQNKLVVALDIYTGKKQVEYEIAGSNKISKIEITPDDAYIIARTDRGQVIFWRKGNPKPRKKIFAEDMVVSKSGKRFSVSQLNGRILRVYTYELPTFRRIEKLYVDRVLRERAKRKTLQLRNQGDPRAIARPSKIVEEGFRLSDVGNYLAFFTEDQEGSNELIVVNTMSGDVILDQELGKVRNLFELEWFSDSLLIPLSKTNPNVFNANTGKYNERLDLQFFTTSRVLSARKTDKLKKISQDLRCALVESKNTLFIRGTDKRATTFAMDGFQFMGFSPNSQLIFVRNVNGRCGFVPVDEAIRGSFPVTYFSNKKIELKEDPSDEPTTNFSNIKRFKGFKHISEANEKDSLYLVFKTIETGVKTGVQVQLVDKNGFYYTGAGDPEWRHIWCNLMLKGRNGKVRQIDDFAISEYQQYDSIPNAISCVMDFSGSMGWYRAEALQNGVGKFIDKKAKDDVVSLVKYDHRVLKLSLPEDDSKKLKSRLTQYDYSFFGGSTALLDAANIGVYSVKDVKNIARKSVLLMTDGRENASYSSMNELIAAAIEGGTAIYTIGYGDFVDEEFLKTIAYGTKGGYYKFSELADFEWIYTDIYRKSNYYYSVNFKSKEVGSQMMVMKICLENKPCDSVAVGFTNQVIDPEILATDENVKTECALKTFGFDHVDTKEFNHPEITNYDRVQNVPAPGVDVLIEEEDTLSQIEDEFLRIDLPQFNFFTDRAEIKSGSEVKLKRLAAFLIKHKTIRLEIAGHTDDAGTEEHNAKLSEDRAKEVKQLLVKEGVKEDRLEARGFGETVPIALNTTEEGRALNRRVEFSIID